MRNEFGKGTMLLCVKYSLLFDKKKIPETYIVLQVSVSKKTRRRTPKSDKYGPNDMKKLPKVSNITPKMALTFFTRSTKDINQIFNAFKKKKKD